MTLNDDAVLAAIQLRRDDAVTAQDLLHTLPKELIARASESDRAQNGALATMQHSIDRLEAAGYLAASAEADGHMVTDAGRSHLVAIGVPPPP